METAFVWRLSRHDRSHCSATAVDRGIEAADALELLEPFDLKALGLPTPIRRRCSVVGVAQGNCSLASTATRTVRQLANGIFITGFRKTRSADRQSEGTHDR